MILDAVGTKAEMRKALLEIRQRVLDGDTDFIKCEECGAPIWVDEDHCSADEFNGCWGAALGHDHRHTQNTPCYSYRMVEKDR